jgi:transposase-like protein
MSKAKTSHRVFSREFKLAIIRRMLAGEDVSALARELMARKDLYVWRDRFLAGGPEALRGRGRPRKAEAAGLAARVRPAAPAKTPGAELKRARDQIAELERKVGQQQLELDFFRRALRQVGGTRRTSAEPGVTASTRSSKR